MRRSITLEQTILLVIIAQALFWYGLVPMAGTLIVRRSWRLFRRRFNELTLKPLLDYAASRRQEAGEYRFTGKFESLTEDRMLWIRSEELTIPVDLQGARTYMIPDTREETIPVFDPGEEIPEKIRWEKLSALTGEARIYVGGSLVIRENRPIFVSTPENPLQIMLYEGPDRFLSIRAVRSGRHKNKYWNFLTPYALIMGAFSQIAVAGLFYTRPAFRSEVIAAFIALFTPFLPLIPPGILLAILYRRLWWRARSCRAYRDLARLPLLYLRGDSSTQGVLPGGGSYGAQVFKTLPRSFYERKLPFIIPEGEKRPGDAWYIFGSLDSSHLNHEQGGENLPTEPADPFAVYGALPGKPETLAARYEKKANALEIVSWLLFLAGTAANMFFVRTIISLLDILPL